MTLSRVRRCQTRNTSLTLLCRAHSDVWGFCGGHLEFTWALSPKDNLIWTFVGRYNVFLIVSLYFASRFSFTQQTTCCNTSVAQWGDRATASRLKKHLIWHPDLCNVAVYSCWALCERQQVASQCLQALLMYFVCTQNLVSVQTGCVDFASLYMKDLLNMS